MGRGKQLSDFEKGQITELYAAKNSIRSIAKRLNRSHHVVSNFIKKGANYGVNKTTGRPRALTNRQKRAVIKEFSNSKSSLRNVAALPSISTSKSTVHRTVQSCNFLQHKKLQVAPKVKPHHKAARVDWAKTHMSWIKDWYRIIFSDEKKFNLDGPDGWAYYWHDIRKDELMFSKQQHGGGSVMVWAGFGAHGKTDIAFISGRMNAIGYQNLLNDHLLPYTDKIGGPFFQFQQDNASIHIAKSTWEWFLSNGIDVMQWPACSPDLNPMENLWGLLARYVYKDGRQFSNVNELKAAIQSAWDEIDDEILLKLVNSMPERVFKVISTQGAFIGY